jgi:hypothetical protein
VTLLTRIARKIGIAKRTPRRSTPQADIRRIEDPAEARRMAFSFSRRGGLSIPHANARVNELLALRTSALYLQVTGSGTTAVVLEPWERRKVSLCGNGWTLDAGEGAPTGVPAWVTAKDARPHRLYETAPDHPVLAVAVRVGVQGEVRCFVPEYLTHATIVVNGRVLAAAQRIDRDREAYVFIDRGRAA